MDAADLSLSLLGIFFDENHSALKESNEVIHRIAFNDPHGRKVDCVWVRLSGLLVGVHCRRSHGDFDVIGTCRNRNVETNSSISLDHLSDES